MTAKKIIPILAVAILVAAIGLLWPSLRGREPAHTIVVSGNLELTQVDISFKIPGKLVERTVDEGDPVKKGMIVARLDRVQALRQRARDNAALLAARSQFRQGETSVEFQRATSEQDVALRKAELRQAQAKLAALVNGSRPQEIDEARAGAADARTQYNQAQADWERAQTLYKNDDISTQQYDQYHARLNSTAALLKQAEQRLSLAVEGPRKEDIEAARADVARAQAAVQLAETERLELKRREEELQASRAEIARSEAQLGISNSQLDDTIAASPIDGVVLVKSAEPGEVLAAGTPVVTIGDVEHPWLRAYIGEQDLGRVKLGQKVKLTTDSFPGKVYWGRVSFIASEAEFTPKQIQTKEERVKLVYRIKIEVDNPNRELKLNMPVDGEIEL